MGNVLVELIPIFVALVGGSMMTKLVEWTLERRTRQAKEERDAWRLYDDESNRRRELQEVLNMTRHAWHKRDGMPYNEMPSKPNWDRS